MPDQIVRNATIITMDEAIGDLDRGDILIRDGRIAEVAPRIESAEDDAADVIDASACIVLPGFVDAHLHSWQAGIRGIAGNWTIPEYLGHMHGRLAATYRPHDIHIGTLMGALNQINGGVTTVFDWSHNNPTPEHSDAGIDALDAAGIRAVFGHGTPKHPPKPGEVPFEERPHPRGEIERLRKGRFAADDGLLSLAMCTLGPDFSIWDVTVQDIALAREFDLIWSAHTWGAPNRLNPEGFIRLAKDGLLGPEHNLVHGNYLSDDELKAITDAGASVTVTPEVEIQMSAGYPLTGRVLANGGLLTLGVDVESNISGDMFTVMRFALQTQRHLDNKAHMAKGQGPADTISIDAREALAWATINGARALRLDDRTGSITPGKAADLMFIDAQAINLFPVSDPVETVVFHATAANVAHVMVAGRMLKRDGTLLYSELAARKSELASSGRRILEEAGLVQ